MSGHNSWPYATCGWSGTLTHGGSLAPEQTITAGALIKHLRNLPPSTPVYMLGEDGEHIPCQYAELLEYHNK